MALVTIYVGRSWGSNEMSTTLDPQWCNNPAVRGDSQSLEATKAEMCFFLKQTEVYNVKKLKSTVAKKRSEKKLTIRISWKKVPT